MTIARIARGVVRNIGNVRSAVPENGTKAWSGRLALAVAIALAAASAPPATAMAPDGGVADEPCTAGTGPYQREMEEFLGLKVDGKQAEEDCRAIRAFQREHDLERADGYADIPTYRTMLVVHARENPNAEGKCPAGRYTVACIDLSRQLLWVQYGSRGEVIYHPVPVRTGKEGLETRSGMHEIYWRNRNHWSTIYDVAMPYAQFFSGGQAMHGTTGDLFESGSGGCVNLYNQNAAELWDLLNLGDKVFVFGVKPGTNPRSLPFDTPPERERPRSETEVDAQGRTLLSDEELIAEGMRLLPPPQELPLPDEWDTQEPPEPPAPGYPSLLLTR